MRSTSVKKLWGLFLFTILVLLLSLIAIMQIDTNSLIDEVRMAFSNEDVYVPDYEFDPIAKPKKYAIPGVRYIVFAGGELKTNLVARYNTKRFALGLDNTSFESSVQRIFALHNFSEGFLWFKYSEKLEDENGKGIISNAGVPVRLTIQKKDGKWAVTDIYEKP